MLTLIVLQQISISTGTHHKIPSRAKSSILRRFIVSFLALTAEAVSHVHLCCFVLYSSFTLLCRHTWSHTPMCRERNWTCLNVVCAGCETSTDVVSYILGKPVTTYDILYNYIAKVYKICGIFPLKNPIVLTPNLNIISKVFGWL